MADYERLSAQDASFLYMESPSAPMHVGSLAIFEDTGADFHDILDKIESRINLVPRFRKKLMWVPYSQGRPVWVDDEHFDLRFHVRHTGVPRPGGEKELLALTSRVFGLPLDRGRPLWEMWIVDLPDDRKAMIQKTHHCLIDGISGVDLATVLLDLTPEGAEIPPAPKWEPAPAPSREQLLRGSLVEGFTKPAEVVRRVRAATRAPRQALSRARELARGLGAFSRASVVESAPRTSVNEQIGPHRRFEVVRSRLDDVKAVKNRFGCTVNDVVLAITAGGLGHLLRARGEDTQGMLMKALVPVSVRSDDSRHTYGNQVSAMAAELPVGELDAQKRLEFVRTSMAGVKESKQAVGADFLIQLTDYAPPTILALAGRAMATQRTINLTVTNVPGPQFPLYFMGGEMLEAFPLVPLIEHTGVGAAILSYNGELNFGLVGDWDTVPDLAIWAEGIEKSLQELQV